MSIEEIKKELKYLKADVLETSDKDEKMKKIRKMNRLMGKALKVYALEIKNGISKKDDFEGRLDWMKDYNHFLEDQLESLT